MLTKANELAVEIGELYWVRVVWRNCADIRPCIVVEAPKGDRVRVVPISGAMPLYQVKVHFLFEVSDPDFAATGLQRTCFASDEELQEAPLKNFGRKMGMLEGLLAVRFWKWLG